MKNLVSKRCTAPLALAVLFCATSIIAEQQERNLIESVTVKRNKVSVTVNPEFKKKYLLSDFFAEYDDDINLEQLPYAVNIMPFIMNVVSIVWISGKDYYIDEMDRKLFASLEKVKEVLKRMYKKTSWKGRLIPRKLVDLPAMIPQENFDGRAALLFSGGLDSVTSSLYHRDQKQLLVTLWGHWDLPLNDKKLWESRRKQLLSFGRKHGHENTFIRSNYFWFLNRDALNRISPEISCWRIFTVEGIGWAGLVAPVMLTKGYPVLLHGSTITWEFNFPAAANPFIDNNIKFADARVEHDLFHMNRLEKCEYIAKLRKEKLIKKAPHIRVCEVNHIVGNCCECQKCVRTILELVVVGENPCDYGFDICSEEMLKKTQKFMKQHANGATTVWHFMHIQKKLQERVERGEKIPEGLEWILEYNFKKKVTADIRHQRTFDWRDFHDLLPELEIPENIEPAF